MKYRLGFLFVLTLLSLYSQSGKEKLSIAKAQLANVYTIQDLIPELPKEIYNYSASMMVNCYGDLQSSASNVCGKIVPGENNKGILSQEHVNLLRNCNVGCTVYIDLKYIGKGGQDVKVKTASFRVVK